MSSLSLCTPLDLFSAAAEAAAYDKIAAAMPARYHRAHRIQNDALAEQLRASHCAPALLELGPGTALDLATLRGMDDVPAFYWTGIDRSSSMLGVAEAEKRLSGDWALDVICADVLRDEAWSGLGVRQFDACFHAFVLHHYSDSERRDVHTRAIERLKVGGLYVVTDLFADDDSATARFFHTVEAQDIGEAVAAAELPREVDRNWLRAAWVQHYLHDNLPPGLLAEAALLRSLGCRVEIAFREVQVAVLLARKEA